MKTLNEETLKRVEEYNISYQQEHGISPSYRQINLVGSVKFNIGCYDHYAFIRQEIAKK